MEIDVEKMMAIVEQEEQAGHLKIGGSRKSGMVDWVDRCIAAGIAKKPELNNKYTIGGWAVVLEQMYVAQLKAQGKTVDEDKVYVHPSTVRYAITRPNTRFAVNASGQVGLKVKKVPAVAKK